MHTPHATYRSSPAQQLRPVFTRDATCYEVAPRPDGSFVVVNIASPAVYSGTARGAVLQRITWRGSFVLAAVFASVADALDCATDLTRER